MARIWPVVLSVALLGALVPLADAAKKKRSPIGSLKQLKGKRGCITQDGRAAEGGPRGRCMVGRAMTDAGQPVLSPDGRNLYVSTDRGLLAFRRNRRTGGLRQLRGTAGCINSDGRLGCAVARGLDSPGAVVISRDGKNVYLGTGGDLDLDGGIIAFRRSARTGALAQLPGTAGCITVTGDLGACARSDVAGAAPETVSRDGRSLYVAGGSDLIGLIARDPVSGALLPVAGPQRCTNEFGTGGCSDGRGLDNLADIILSRDGRFAYASGYSSMAIAVFARDRNTGVLTQLPGQAGCISQDGTDHQEFVDRDGTVIQPAGTPGACAAGRVLDGANELAIVGRNLYVSVQQLDGISVFRVDRANGRVTQLGGKRGCITDPSRLGASQGCAKGRAIGFPFGIAANRKSLYAAASSGNDSAIAVLRRRTTDGALKQLKGKRGCVSERVRGCSPARATEGVGSLVLSPDNRFLYSAQGSVGRGLAIFKRRR